MLVQSHRHYTELAQFGGQPHSQGHEVRYLSQTVRDN